jgi:hypothetical protein
MSVRQASALEPLVAVRADQCYRENKVSTSARCTIV